MKSKMYALRIFVTLIFLCNFYFVISLAQPPSKVQDNNKPIDKDPTATYLDTLRKIESEQNEKIKIAQKKYAEELDIGINNAFANKNLLEANRLTDLKKNLVDDIKFGRIPSPDSRIMFAAWGAKSKWINVTSQILRLGEEKKFPFIPEKSGFADPAVGSFKSLIIVYGKDNRVRVEAWGHDELVQPGARSIRSSP
jgi:hypothetical protein